jgi:DNA replication protein DnaC
MIKTAATTIKNINESKNIKENIYKIAKKLKLDVIANYSSIVNNKDSFEVSLLKLLNTEFTQKEERSIARRIKNAGFPIIKTIDTFEFDRKRIPHFNKDEFMSLLSCEFIENKHNCVMLGNSGTGKSHASIALAIEAIKKGYIVKFKSASDIVNQMEEAQRVGTTTKYITTLNKCHLLVIDELGYLNYDLPSASRLFQIFASRYETKSTIVTTNLEFSKWVNFLGDQTLATALIDRLIHMSTIFNMNGESYRLKKACENKNKK